MTIEVAGDQAWRGQPVLLVTGNIKHLPEAAFRPHTAQPADLAVL